MAGVPSVGGSLRRRGRDLHHEALEGEAADGHEALGRAGAADPLHEDVEIGEAGFVVGDVELVPIDDRPCQVTFFKLTSELPEDEAYGSHATDAFQHQVSALPKTKPE
jgi:hypothetical protein